MKLPERGSDMMSIDVAKAGTNPDQRPTQVLSGVRSSLGDIKVGEVFHVAGQPKDVLWRVVGVR